MSLPPPPSTVPHPFALKDSSAIPTTDFTKSIQKLTHLSSLLESAQYSQFWYTLTSDDLYADLCVDVAGFEDLVRIRVAGEVGKAFRELDLETLGQWLDLDGELLTKFAFGPCGWKVVGGDKGGGAAECGE